MKLRTREEWEGLADKFLAGEIAREFLVSRIEDEEAQMLELLRLVSVWRIDFDICGDPFPKTIQDSLNELFGSPTQTGPDT